MEAGRTRSSLRYRSDLRARLALADRMTSLGMLAAGAAHEIATPLAAIAANLDFLRGVLDDASRLAGSVDPSMPEKLAEALRNGSEALEDALAGAQHASGIVRDLKAFSRPAEEHRVPIEVRIAVDRALRLVSPELRHRARLMTEFQETPQVLGSESLLTQVFVDLLVNAGQALLSASAVDNLIAVRVWADGGDTVVDVRDTGSGIPEALLHRIFEPFFTTKPPELGTGLGLWTCRQIVSAHGGRIEVDSTPGRGTRMRVRLPACGADAGQATARNA